MSEIRFAPTFEEWRRAARPLLTARVRPETVTWIERDVIDAAFLVRAGKAPVREPPVAPGPAVQIPAAFVTIAKRVAAHRDPKRWALLYKVAFRITGGERRLLEDENDPEVHALRVLGAGVAREVGRLPAQSRRAAHRQDQS